MCANFNLPKWQIQKGPTSKSKYLHYDNEHLIKQGNFIVLTNDILGH